MAKTRDEYLRVAQMLSGLTFSIPVSLMTLAKIEEIEAAAVNDPVLASLVKELHDKLKAVTRPEDYERMAQCYEAYSEIAFYRAATGRGVPLSRTPGTGKQNQKRPDFVHQRHGGDLYFEIKALEIADSLFRHKELAERALDNAADLAERAKKPGIHFSEPLEISGALPAASTVERIDQTIAKIMNNVKPGQIYWGPTVLVVDLGRFAGIYQGASGLLPVFFHDGPPAQSCVSGELWQIAFGNPGERVFELPEFDGKSNLAGHQTREGILRAHPGLVAIAFMVPRLSAEPEIFTIWNKRYDQTRLTNAPALNEHQLYEVLDDVSDGVNDTTNEDGWAHTVHPARP